MAEKSTKDQKDKINFSFKSRPSSPNKSAPKTKVAREVKLVV